jgi:hypothetical protein
MVSLAIAALVALSPWWEDYATTETFLCPNQGRVVLERNDAQASLITGRFRSTLFRDPRASGDVRYRNEWMTVILRGDVLTMERLPSRIDCLRTEQV